MDVAYFMRQLKGNAARILFLVQNVSAEEAIWKPDPQSWSILEVINHLYDEEKEDFRVRLDIILHDPEKDWPPIDPDGWVNQRRYNELDLEESLQYFLVERETSMAWLRGLDDPDWDAYSEAPFGRVTAGDLFVSWVTHDQLHMRQLVELHRAYTELKAEPYRLRYAGDW